MSTTPAPFPLDKAQIISTWMGAVTFGAMLVSLFVCLRVLFSSESALNRLSFKVLMTVSITMAILDGIDKSLQLQHMLDAFVYYKGPGGALEQLNKTRNAVNFAKTVVYVIQTWLGDGVLVYRCVIVYNKRWYGVFPPLVLFISSLTMGSLMIYFTYTESHGPITGEKLKPIILSFLLLSLAQNIAITLAIAFRLLFLQRNMKHEMHTSTLSRIRKAIIIIIESGAIYSCSMVILVGAFVTNNVTDYGWSGVASSIIPIAFNLIIIRVHRGRAVDQEAAATKAADLTVNRTRRLTPQMMVPMGYEGVGLASTALLAKTLVNEHSASTPHEGALPPFIA